VPQRAQVVFWSYYAAVVAAALVPGLVQTAVAVVSGVLSADVARSWPLLGILGVITLLGALTRLRLPDTKAWFDLATVGHIVSILLVPPPFPFLIAVLVSMPTQIWKAHGDAGLYLARQSILNAVYPGWVTTILSTVTMVAWGRPLLSAPSHGAAVIPSLAPLALAMLLTLVLAYDPLDRLPLLPLPYLMGQLPWARGALRRSYTSFVPINLATAAAGVPVAASALLTPALALFVLIPFAVLHYAIAAHDRTRAQATQDGLTGLANHRTFRTRLDQAVADTLFFDTTLSLLVVDLDHFSAVNNTHGHQAGDAVLTAVAREIAQSVRTIDIAARQGGDEFAVILPHTSVADSLAIAHRLCTAINGAHVRVGDADNVIIPLACSVGVATLPAHAATASDLLAAADRGAYAAKRGGKGRVGTPEDADAAPGTYARDARA